MKKDEIIILSKEDYYNLKLSELKKLRCDGYETSFNEGMVYFVKNNDSQHISL